ncbi:MAG: TIGR01777 family oxidoreductase [Chitinophagaceae bacterium]
MATVLITGGTGLIGRSLQKLLAENNYKVIVLTRDPGKYAKKSGPGLSFAAWDVEKQQIDIAAIQQADFIIHLAGEGIADKRWTDKRKMVLLSSRVDSSTLVVNALRLNENKVQAVVSASAIGWYGEDPKIPNPHPFMEDAPADGGFLGEICSQWEQSIQPVEELGIRLVKFRTGIVLSRDGGAYPELRRPVYFGVAGILSKGRQIYSWIHIDDMARMYLAAIENLSYSGVYNAVAPKPASNKELTVKMASLLKKNFFIPVYIPSLFLKIGLGEMSQEVLKSTTVCCDKIRKAGFNFIYPSIESALGELTSPAKN